MRTFNLVNGEGQVYTLTVSNKYTGFLATADGLGYEKSNEYQKIGSSFTQLTDSISQKVISGVVYFFQPYAYQEFSKFALFCQSKDLTLYYRTPTGEYRKDGSITKIEKSEGADSLKVKIEFTPVSLWYQSFKEVSTNGSIKIYSESQIESPCCLSFKGITKNNETLAWSQNHDDVEIMTGELDNVTIAATDTVYIRTDTNPYKIYKMSQGVEGDLYGKSDFATKRFPILYKGVNEIIVTGASEITVEGKILYETV